MVVFTLLYVYMCIFNLQTITVKAQCIIENCHNKDFIRRTSLLLLICKVRNQVKLLLVP